MQELHDIFAIWPNLAALAAEIGQKPDTVYRWKRTGRIPENFWTVIIEKAATRERLVTVAQLHALNRPAKQRGRPAHRNQLAQDTR